MPEVSVIVPCFNEEKTIVLLLDALYRQTQPRADLEIIIADGFSTDRTRTVIAEYQRTHPDLSIRVVDNPARTIPSGLNAAITAAHGEFIVRLDAHSVPASDYVERCLNDLKSGLGDNVGGIWEIRPGSPTRIARAISLAAAHPFGVGDASYRLGAASGPVDTVPFGAYRRSLVDKIGLYDPTLLSNEDYEFNTRIRQSGGIVYLDSLIRCIYYSRATLPALARQYSRYGYWKYQMLRRYPGTLRWRQALPPVFVFGMLLLALLAPWWSLAALTFLGVTLLYLLTLGAGSMPLARRHHDPALIYAIPLAIIVMHFCWGGGFLWSIISTVFRRTG